MTKTTVPRDRSNNSKGMGNSSKGGNSVGRWSERPRKTHRVQWDGAIRPDDHVLGCKILHRQTKRVKFHRAPIVSGKTMNKKETLNHVRSKQNVVKVKWPGRTESPTEVIGREEPLPTTIDEGLDKAKGRRVEILPTDGVEWCGVVRRAGVRHPVLHQGRGRVERHGAEGVGQ
jgi:hypothetical protein